MAEHTLGQGRAGVAWRAPAPAHRASARHFAPRIPFRAAVPLPILASLPRDFSPLSLSLSLSLPLSLSLDATSLSILSISLTVTHISLPRSHTLPFSVLCAREQGLKRQAAARDLTVRAPNGAAPRRAQPRRALALAVHASPSRVEWAGPSCRTRTLSLAESRERSGSVVELARGGGSKVGVVPLRVGRGVHGRCVALAVGGRACASKICYCFCYVLCPIVQLECFSQVLFRIPIGAGGHPRRVVHAAAAQEGESDQRYRDRAVPARGSRAFFVVAVISSPWPATGTQ